MNEPDEDEIDDRETLAERDVSREKREEILIAVADIVKLCLERGMKTPGCKVIGRGLDLEIDGPDDRWCEVCDDESMKVTMTFEVSHRPLSQIE